MNLKSKKQQLLSWLPDTLVWVRGPQQTGQYYLSFDDGPHPEHTPRLLDLLARHAVRASFFVIGEAAERYPDIIRRMLEEGHALGNHSWSHPMFGQLEYAAQVTEIECCDRLLETFDGCSRHAFRPPRGELSLRLLWHFARQGRRVVYWSRDSLDYRKLPADDLINAFAADCLTEGDIVLMHDDSACAAVMLAVLLPRWQQQGLCFAALPLTLETT